MAVSSISRWLLLVENLAACSSRDRNIHNLQLPRTADPVRHWFCFVQYERALPHQFPEEHAVAFACRHNQGWLWRACSVLDPYLCLLTVMMSRRLQHSGAGRIIMGAILF